LTVNTLQALLQMIDEKQKLLQLLNEYIDGPGLTVVIGAEHLDPSLRPFSLVLSTYDDGGAGIGTRRRARADAHALLPRDCRRRRRGAGGLACVERSQLDGLTTSATLVQLVGRTEAELIALKFLWPKIQ
jgi:hypothetical protein